MFPRLTFQLCVLSLCLALPLASRAALGGVLDTVTADQATMHASRRVAHYSGYDIHELTLSTGTVVREFVTPSGTVFGVSWQGPHQPNLDQLLGGHFTRLVQAAQTPHGDHRRLALHASDLVIESGGRMRGFAGRAYLPALVPTTLTPSEIK